MSFTKYVAVFAILALLLAVHLEAKPLAGDDNDDSSWTNWFKGHANTAIDAARDTATTGWSYLKQGTKYSVTAARKGLETLEQRMQNSENGK